MMTRRALAAAGLMLAAALLIAVRPGAAADRLAFGVTPWKDPQALKAGYAPVIAHLGQAIGRDVVLHVAKDYGELADRIRDQAVDVAFLSSSAYVDARDRIAGLAYLATANQVGPNGQVRSFYNSLIVVLKDSPYKQLQDLRQLRMGFTDPSSSSGYRYPMLHLKKAGIDPAVFFSATYMLKKHDKVAAALAAGSIEVGAVGDTALAGEIPKLGDIFRTLVEIGPIPNDAVAAGPHVRPDLREKVQKALVALGPNSEPIRQAMAAGFTYPGYVVAPESYYDIVREVSKAFADK